VSGSITAWGWQETLARWFGRGDPAVWYVALNRVYSDRWGGLAEPHAETNYTRRAVPNTLDHWLGMTLPDHEEITSWQNRSPLSWLIQPQYLDKWLPIVGWALCDPEGRVVFSADLPFPVTETTLDGLEVRLRPGEIYVTGVWLGSGVAYWEVV
jgi:hypothetical protein